MVEKTHNPTTNGSFFFAINIKILSNGFYFVTDPIWHDRPTLDNTSIQTMAKTGLRLSSMARLRSRTTKFIYVLVIF